MSRHAMGGPPDATLAAFDEAAGIWLVLEAAGVSGQPVWLVIGRIVPVDGTEAHRPDGDEVPRAWLLHDPGLGWMTTSGRGWSAVPSARCHLTEAVARGALAANPHVALHALLHGPGSPPVDHHAAASVPGALPG